MMGFHTSERIYLNNDWKYSTIEEADRGNVRIPHTVAVTPFNYFDEKIYQKISEYKKSIFIPNEYEGLSLRLTFEGVAHESAVYINDAIAATHTCGYTAFTVDITEKANYGEENEIRVVVNSKEDINQPPFGFVIDYMTYGGIYRDVYLTVSEKVYINDIFIHSDSDNTRKLVSEVEVTNPELNEYEIRQYICQKRLVKELNKERTEDQAQGKELKRTEGQNRAERAERGGNPAHGEDEKLIYEGTIVDKRVLRTSELDVFLWDTDNPNLYEIKTVLIDSASGEVVDEKTDTWGFRKAEFKKDGFYLNDKKLRIRGLNRHQSYAYTGYAMPDSQQEFDAVVLKKELGLNAVRTSHYPQSHAFVSKCDELGLLVFTEIPGWQHIGDEEWKNIAIKNTEDMVRQYRNHPSIILWGVRINESNDDDEFYIRTNEVARKLDPTRATGGVRAFKKSHLFEDVYTYNDFSHDGTTPGCEGKRKVTSNMDKAFLITEYNGHMYPVKSYDDEEQRREHVLRHANVINAVAGQEDIAGSFGWCMADYNTHKDFGSGDRICYHGVLDMFRNPKPAAFVYSAEGAKEPVLEIASTMDIGEHPGCNRGDTYILSNADSVRMYKNGRLLKEYVPSDSSYKNLSHGPIRIDDFIGNAIHEGENFTKKQADMIKDILNATALNGMNKLPMKIWAKAAFVSLRYHMSISDAVALYNKYVGDWGQEATEYKFEAVKDGEVVKTVFRKPLTSIKLWAEADHTNLIEGKTYDVALIRIRAVDDNDNQVYFYNEPVVVKTEGPIEVIGDSIFSLKGGMGGVYVKTTGEAGEASISIETSQCNTVNIKLYVEK